MHALIILTIAISLSMDAFSLALAYGTLNLEKKENLSNYRTILIVQADNKIIGLIIDKLIGTQEILHKKLALPIQKLKNIQNYQQKD